MSHYILVDADGFVIGGGNQRNLSLVTVPDGAKMVKGIEFPPWAFGEFKCRLVDGEVVKTDISKRPTDYKTQRMDEYPSIAEQLDAFWKGGEAAEEMRQRVLAVKEKYPKG